MPKKKTLRKCFVTGGGSSYGGSPWDAQGGGNQGWGGQQMSQQSWGGSAQGGGYGAADPWSTQQSQGYGQQQGYGGGGGGPMRSSSYAGGNRSAPYGKD